MYTYTPSSDSENLLKIERPNFFSPTDFREEDKKWINGKWEDFKSTITINNEIFVEKEIIKDGEKKVISVLKEISPLLKNDLIKKIQNREDWVKRNKKIKEVRDLFDELYLKYLDLKREKETLELILGNGILRIPEKGIIYPVLLKKINIKFDATKNIIYIKNFEKDREYNSELYTDFLTDQDDINLNEIFELNNIVKEKNIYPLDTDKIDNFFRNFIHKLSLNGQYTKDIKDKDFLYSNKITIEDNPLIFIRKKSSGIPKIIDGIIKNINETNNIPSHLGELIGDSKEKEEINFKTDKPDIAENEIFLVKEINKEQLEIVKKIEKNKAVVVQGPPGTGKTHTIANLLGHFLAQGKNILVTSQTEKALKVLKEKIPKNIQGLCISLLEDNNSDMRRSVESIMDKMGTSTSSDLKKEIDDISKKRLEEYNLLKNIKDKIYKIKFKESQSLVYNGESFSIKEVGEYLRTNQDKLKIIPGYVSKNSPCPITNTELDFLNQNKKIISEEELKEINLELLDPKILKETDELENILSQKNKAKKELEELLGDKKYSFTDSILYVDNIKYIDVKKYESAKNNNKLNFDDIKNLKNWQLKAIKDGCSILYRKNWESLIKEIEEVYNLAIKFSGKVIDFKNLNNEEVQALVSELRAAIIKPGFLFFKSKLKKATENVGEKILIDNKKIETIEDCDLILSYLDFQSKKEKLKNNYFNLIVDGSVRDDDYFLENLKSSIENIKYYLNWCSSEKEKLISKLKNIGIEKNIFFEKEEKILSDIDNIPKNVTVLEIMLDIAEVSLKVYNLNKNYQEYLEFLEKAIKNFNRNSAKINIEIKDSILFENIEHYNLYLQKLKTLILKKDIFIKKKNILEKIDQVSFEWGNYLRKEEFEIEEDMDIYDLWKWKQLSQELEELEKDPYETLLKKSESKYNDIKRLTLLLVEKLSWYHILCFIEKKENSLVRQALVGWKQSIEKIGKGYGKRVGEYKKEAKEKMKICQKAVPAWIMPINKVFDSFDFATDKFDVIIVDEASQLDITSLPLLYMAKKIIIVGDDKQVSPNPIGVNSDNIEVLRKKYLNNILNNDLYDLNSSLYSIASTAYQPLMLKEHFRCVPEIISYSNKTSYNFKIKPLREANSSDLKPAVVPPYRVVGIRNESKKTNEVEAKTIVSLIKACLEEDLYKNSSFGVISLLGNEQTQLIQKLLIEKIQSIDIEKHNILCGTPSQFQGDERDVIFLTMVDSNQDPSTRLKTKGEGAQSLTKKNYNVAVSRAKNQIWIVHSLDISNDLKQGDIRRELLEFAENPKNFMLNENVKEKSDSIFEEEVAKYLIAKDYNVQQQYEVGSYRIDMVVSYGEKRIAIECDGERYHSSEEQIKNDIERQETLERCGWEFIRIRGSKYFKNPDQTLKELEEALSKKEIYPEKQYVEIEHSENTEITDRIKERARKFLNEWEDLKSDDIVDESTLIQIKQETK